MPPTALDETPPTLVDFLGQTQPLTVFGDRAGVMRITLPNGADVFALGSILRSVGSIARIAVGDRVGVLLVVTAGRHT